MKASNDLFSELILLLQSFLIKSATDLRRSEEAVPNEFEVKIRLQPSAYKPDRPEPRLVMDAAIKNHFFINCVKNNGMHLFYWSI